MVHRTIAATVASVSEFTKNLMGPSLPAKGFPVAILNGNVPVFFSVPPTRTKRCSIVSKISN